MTKLIADPSIEKTVWHQGSFKEVEILQECWSCQSIKCLNSHLTRSEMSTMLVLGILGSVSSDSTNARWEFGVVESDAALFVLNMYTLFLPFCSKPYCLTTIYTALTLS